MPDRFAAVGTVLRDGISARAFPGSSIEVGRGDRAIWSAAFGTLTYDPDSPAVSGATVFDLASLTKVMSTATLVMRTIDSGQLQLDMRVADLLTSWRGADREAVTIRDLLSHSSGLTAYLPLFRDHRGRQEFEYAIGALPLEYAPGTQSLYSDLGFMLLAFILEDISVDNAGSSGTTGLSDRSRVLAEQFHRIVASFTTEALTFNPPRAWRDRTAPTEFDKWRGRLLIGEAHDENAWALGGAAGHAGLFGTSAAVGAFARAVLRTIAGEPILAHTATMKEFIRRRSEIPRSSRALAWDTMLPSSSCGTRLSPSAIGHTGFTGTSVWIDWERDLYIVLLTNRVHPTRENEAIRQIRPRVHDLVIEEIDNC